MKHLSTIQKTRILSRTLTGAWIETVNTARFINGYICRTLTGAWIETEHVLECRTLHQVAPSRVRGLKRCNGVLKTINWCRTLTGAWIETLSLTLLYLCSGRTLTGAWIETQRMRTAKVTCRVAPSRVRGLKQCTIWREQLVIAVAPSRVRGLKLWMYDGDDAGKKSHPHGCVD